MGNKSEIKLEFLSCSGINPFAANNSSPRMVMDSNHISQALSLVTPSENVIKTGIEYELGKYINDVKTRHNCVLKSIVPKYTNTLTKQTPSAVVFTEYEHKGRVYLDLEEIRTTTTNHNFFGFETEYTNDILDAYYNKPIPKDTKLTKTKTLSKNGSYMYGISANVVFMSHPSVAEDGICISESFAERSSYCSVTKRVININKDTIPINLYGSNGSFKFLPDIGCKTLPSGLLCGIKERNDWFSISDLEDTNISNFDPTFDVGTYVNTSSTVVDIEVLRGDVSRVDLPPKTVEQLDLYANELMSFYRNVVNAYNTILKERKALAGGSKDYKLTPRLSRYIGDCMVHLEASGNTRIKLTHKKVPIDGYRIVVTVKSNMSLNYGDKLTDIHASKGVVCRIVPDEDMPKDEFGNTADVIMDDTSTMSRMNVGRAYELYLGSVSRDNRQRIISMMNQPQSVIYDYLKGLYSLINPDMVEFLDSLTPEELSSHIADICSDNLYIYLPPDNEYKPINIVENIESSIYKPNIGKLSFTDVLGNRQVTVDNIRIGVMYLLILEKTADIYAAVSSSRVNNYGLPVKSSNGADKYKTPYSMSPTKTMSETEVRILSSFGDPVMIADMLDYNLNTLAHKSLINNILSDKRAFSNDYGVDRSIVGYGQTRPLSILRHIFNGYGFDVVNNEEKE